ncbi:gamma-glutamyltransferase [Pseudoroseomonas cervicalis]|uniref:Glutathione hydrolase proenzyme n=1 Tax=Pseudoroseomonas cervicalis ATCC 49957 TaxID=525371 RepID=D5RT34_9PROT|nr:gamma-glutamyltransferase [Pseudoroseomonas cervicalis]EFH09536.1 gamma-glutamyltransferase [Pseudoroseomonas cervicalis ATCC 49957]
MRGIVVAAQPEAAEAGVEILRQGGNAVDAAIACAFSQGVVDPQMCGIGGFGAMQICMPKQGVHSVLEFFARAPLSATPEMWADKFIGQSRDGFVFLLNDQSNDIGYGSVGTPGNVAGYTEALSRFGTMPLRDVMAPAIAQSRRGVMVRPYVHYYWALDHGNDGQVNVEDKLRFSETGRQVYFRPDGRLKRPGDMLRNPEMTRTLERIAEGGADVFYRGDIAREIAADMAARGGGITLEDLAAYRVREKSPCWGAYRGLRVASNPPPAGGGSLIELLHILAQFDLGALEHNSVEHLRILAEAMKWMTIDKDAHMGDPDFVDVPMERLLSDAHARALAARIRAGEKAAVPRAEEPRDPPDTTVVCVVDAAGNAVSMTHTLGIPSGVITPGLGFMYNGCMSGFDPRPGRAASIAPGKSRASAMAPTILFEGEQPCMVLAAPGGTYIVPALAQAISNVVDFGMSMAEAVAAPRIVALSDTIDVANRIPHGVTDALAALGYPVARSYQSYAFGAPHGLALRDGAWQGGADPQRDGMALRA